jgi:hypothetical protein
MWNGRTWTNQQISGAPSSHYAWLSGVSCESARKCEAVGNYPAYTCTSGICIIPPVAWAAGLSGNTWVVQPSMTSLYPQASGAFGVSCWRSGCMAVGRSGPDPTRTFAARWNGSTWSQQGAIGAGAPADSDNNLWLGVHCQSASRCTAAGYYTLNFGPDETGGALISTWNGSTWSQVNAPPGGNNSYLAGLACAHGGSVCTAVGGQSGLALAERN